jgi:hypothetical protein
METILAVFYLVLFTALIFFGPLQEFVYRKKSEWDAKKRKPEEKAHATPLPAEPEKTGSILAIVLVILALAFFLWKILTTSLASL